MSIYFAYSYFRRVDGLIFKANLKKGVHGALILFAGENRFIEVNKNDSLEEQVKTVIHELLHISREWSYLNLGTSNNGLEYPESMIEEETQIVYENQPKLVKNLEKLILKPLPNLNDYSRRITKEYLKSI